MKLSLIQIEFQNIKFELKINVMIFEFLNKYFIYNNSMKVLYK